MPKIQSLSVLITFALLPFQSNGSWLERKAEGWAWYEDMAILQKIEPEKIEEVLIPSEPKALSAAEKAAIIRKDLEEKLAQAVLEPTEENIENYMREQKKWINQSALFSSLWTKILLEHPELDSTTEFPISQYGIQLYKQIRQDELFAMMNQLITEYGLFFFYEGKDKRSQAFSLVVQEFAKKYGWEVIAISQDGSLIEGFKDNELDNGAAQKLGVETFPALFLVDPYKEDVRPIAYGLASIDRIEENILLQFQNLEGN